MDLVEVKLYNTLHQERWQSHFNSHWFSWQSRMTMVIGRARRKDMTAREKQHHGCTCLPERTLNECAAILLVTTVHTYDLLRFDLSLLHPTF